MDREQLGTALENLDQGAERARLWVDELRHNSTSVAQQAESLVEAARRARLAARRLGHAAKRNNCVGVFGPSQAGKSYLVSTLAREREAEARLTIRLGDDKRDFLREINPPGDRESTGLVTRFTIDPGEVDPAFPVDIRLLTETDLVKILANSFFLDFDPNAMSIPPVEEEHVREAIRKAEGAQGAKAAHLDEIALFDLCEYLRHNFKSRVGAFERTDLWSALVRLGGNLNLADRADMYALFWGKIPEFTDLFIHLVEALDKVSHPADARVAENGLIPRENSIIDVAILKQLRTPKDAEDQVGLKPVVEGASETSLPRATLTALIAEVRLVIDVKPWPFFDHTDLLDFPGARSRLKLTALPSDPEDREQQVRELFLRGKIAYLFQRYTDELELTSMLLCMPPSNAEVKDLAGMVKAWIAATHGATPERRKAVRNALFLVLTKHDMEFSEKDGETRDSRLGKWDRRLHASLIELYGKDGWPENWNGKPFSSTYFLRNPGMKQIHLMEYNDIETLDEKQAVASPSFQELREGFMTSPDVERHFANREQVWEAALSPNDGGVSYLVENIVAVLDPDLKRKQAAERLVEASEALSQPLRGLYFAEGDEARREKDVALTTLRRALHDALKVVDLGLFAHVQRALMLKTADIRGAFLNVASMREDDLERMTGETEEVAAPSFDDDPWADDPAPQADLAKPPPRRERPEVFAEQIMNLWAARMRDFQQDETALNALGIRSDIVGQIIDELLIGASRLGLAGRVSDDIRRVTQAAGLRWADVADRAVRVTSGHLNDFVAYLDFGNLDPTARPGFPEAPKPASRSIYTLDSLRQPGREPGERREEIARAAFTDWGIALRQFGNANVGHNAGREITQEQNAALGEVLDLIDLGAKA